MNLDTFLTGRRLFEYHASLLRDGVRLGAYSRSLSDVVQQGDVVLDVGTGTGILALLACRAGAKRVYAVEQSGAIELAKAVAAASDVRERVVFLEGHSTAVDLPEHVDVIVTETLWNFGLGEGLLATIIDARDRFLRDGGTIVPRSFEMHCSLAAKSDVYERLIGVWDRPMDGVQFSALRTFATNNVYVATFSEADLLTDPVVLAKVSLLEAGAGDVKTSATCRVTRSGTAHGLAGWFLAELSEGIDLSNAPPVSTSSWDHAFLPFEAPVDVEAGSKVEITVATSADDSHWSWGMDVIEGSTSATTTRSSRQSTLLGLPTSTMQQVRRRAGDYRPEPSPHAEAAAFVLGSFDRKTTLRHIEKELQSSYADLFSSEAQARAFIRDLVALCVPPLPESRPSAA